MENKHFLITETSSAADAIINLKLKNLPSCTEMMIRTETKGPYYCINAPLNYSTETKWIAENKYLSDEKGNLDLNTAPAISGSYQGVSPMGCLSFLSAKKITKKKKETNLDNISLNAAFSIKLEVYMDKIPIDSCVIERYFMNEKIAFKQVAFSASKGRYFYPKEATNLPAIIVVSGSEGGVEKAQAIAQLLASHGFATLAISYFGLDDLAVNLAEIPLEIIEEGLDFLALQEEVNKDRIGIYGRSKGAEFALLAASNFAKIKCIVANSPTNVVYEGIKQHLPAKKSSWTFQTMPIQYVPFKFGSAILAKIKGKEYPDNTKKMEAEIPVEKIKGNILLISAIKDEIWPAYSASLMIQNRLNLNQFPYKFELALYPNSGHMLTLPFQPNNRYKKKNNVTVMEETLDAWQKTVDFFKENL